MIKTRYEKLKTQMAKILHNQYELSNEKEQKKDELDRYVKRHKSLRYDMLETNDVHKLEEIYRLLDRLFSVEWEGGLRCDCRGMKLCYWIYDDPDYLIIHLTSTSKNICFSGSTSWIAKAKTIEKKIEILKYVKTKVSEIIKRKETK